MQPADFKRWRKSLGLSQKEAAKALGLKRRMVQYYEKGQRDGKSVEVPRAVRLACYALAQGVSDYGGPEDGARADAQNTADGGAEDNHEPAPSLAFTADKLGSVSG